MTSPLDESSHSPLLQMNSSGSQIMVDAPLPMGTVGTNNMTTEEQNDINNPREQDEAEESS